MGLVAWNAPDDERMGRSFAGHQADLRVERMSLGKTRKRAEYQFAGIVTNGGNYPWRVRELEVRLRARDGEIIEVLHPQISEPFVVQPAQEAAFRLSLSSAHPDVINAELQARVQDASDGNQPADPD